LNNADWQVVRAAGSKKEENALALRQSEAAVYAAPGNENIHNTLGVCYYRQGDYERALQTLTQSERLNATKDGSLPADLAFLAMAQHRLGKKDEAKTTLDRLREIMKQARWTDDAEAQGFLREAEETLKQKPASQKK
jgi:Tfp pilus assembly protein PilF